MLTATANDVMIRDNSRIKNVGNSATAYIRKRRQFVSWNQPIS